MTREEAKKILKAISVYECYPKSASEETKEAIDMAIEALKERPQGEWKHTITWQPYCSNCEYVFGEDEEYSPFWKFCPMCGAEMADNSLVNDITESPNDVVESKDDVIKVVRCKDCRWWQNDYMGTWCGRLSGVRFTNDDDYCSHGERQCNYFGERREE